MIGSRKLTGARRSCFISGPNYRRPILVTASLPRQATLAPIRVSDYDGRPYKPLTLAPAKAAGEAPNVFVVAHVDVAPHTQAPMLLQQVAGASRQEPGNLRFDVLQHAMRGNHSTVIEQWRDQDALDAHVATTHARAYRDALQPLTGSPLGERVYTPIPR
jgi:quinol monooxygenase YgiN